MWFSIQYHCHCGTFAIMLRMANFKFCNRLGSISLGRCLLSFFPLGSLCFVFIFCFFTVCLSNFVRIILWLQIRISVTYSALLATHSLVSDLLFIWAQLGFLQGIGLLWDCPMDQARGHWSLWYIFPLAIAKAQERNPNSTSIF